MMNSAYTRTPILPAWLLWLIALTVVFFGLGSFAILDNNEGLYAEIPREMLAADNWRAWVIPHLNGLPYIEKPPLLYWLTALSMAIFGESAWAVRLVPALSALGCVGLLQWFGEQSGRALAGRVGALMFITGLGVMAMSHVLMFDVLLAFLFTGALVFGWRFVRTDGSEADRALRYAYAFLALAILAKGLVALVLFALVMGLHSLINVREAGGLVRAVIRWFNWRALLLFLLIAVPWHIVAGQVEAQFSWFYFENEHVLRFLGQREPHDYHAGAWWYYLPRLFVFLYPWSLLVFALIGRRRAILSESPGLASFLWLAWLVPLLFFSLSTAKANYYLIAILPFAAFHFAVDIEARGWFSGFGRASAGLLQALLAGGVIVTLVMRGTTLSGELTIWGLSLTHFVLLALGVTALLAAAGAILAWRLPRIGILAYLSLPAWMLVLLLGTLEAMEPTISTRQTARYLQSELPSHTVYLYRDFEQQSSLPFYLHSALPVVEMRSADLFWGNRQRPGNTISLAPHDFASILPNRKVAIVVMDRHIQDFRAAPFFAAFTNEKRIGNSTIFHN